MRATIRRMAAPVDIELIRAILIKIDAPDSVQSVINLGRFLAIFRTRVKQPDGLVLRTHVD